MTALAIELVFASWAVMVAVSVTGKAIFHVVSVAGAVYPDAEAA